VCESKDDLSFALLCLLVPKLHLSNSFNVRVLFRQFGRGYFAPSLLHKYGTLIPRSSRLTNGIHHCFSSDDEVEHWLNSDQLSLNMPDSAGLPGLFAYPGQSNMNGRRLPLSWPRKLRQSQKAHHQDTYSLLDAAALATTTQLDFSDPDSAPDFTALSFYKIFGFPDLGALIVRRKSGHILSWRRYFGGGTVNLVTVFHEATVQRKDDTIHDVLEDGTLPFHNIIALGCAINVHKQLYGSMKTISQHTSYLSKRLYLGMKNICYSNGQPVCVIYNEGSYDDPATQGATVAFNVVRSDGSQIGHTLVEQLANDEGIFVRSGGLCNSGGISSYLQVEHWQFKRAWSAGFRCGGDKTGVEIINGKQTGVVRVSLGAMSTIADVDKFLYFLEAIFLEGYGMMDVTKADDHHAIRSGHEAAVRRDRDSGFHSGTDDSSSQSVTRSPKGVWSPANWTGSKPKLYQQLHGGQPGPVAERMVHTSQIPQSRPDTVTTTIIPGDLRLAGSRQEQSKMFNTTNQLVTTKKRSKLKFWRGRK
jgi:selenocysteine lyase/cysteine desulfurase